MYAAVRRYEAEPRFADELVDREDEIKDLLHGIPGFRTYSLVRTARGVISLSVYDDQAGADESTRQAADWIPTSLPAMRVSAPEVSSGEVIVQF